MVISVKVLSVINERKQIYEEGKRSIVIAKWLFNSGQQVCDADHIIFVSIISTYEQYSLGPVDSASAAELCP